MGACPPGSNPGRGSADWNCERRDKPLDRGPFGYQLLECAVEATLASGSGHMDRLPGIRVDSDKSALQPLPVKQGLSLESIPQRRCQTRSEDDNSNSVVGANTACLGNQQWIANPIPWVTGDAIPGETRSPPLGSLRGPRNRAQTGGTTHTHPHRVLVPSRYSRIAQ